jgi:hypothetical protein
MCGFWAKYSKLNAWKNNRQLNWRVHRVSLQEFWASVEGPFPNGRQSRRGGFFNLGFCDPLGLKDKHEKSTFGYLACRYHHDGLGILYLQHLHNERAHC